MKSVLDNSSILIIKKSKFITFTYNIDCIEDVYNKLNEIKDKYNDATHICYAYIINNNEKCYDDNEPKGTAGLPILNVLKKENLNNVVCFIVRYFGGIKLGAGGLVRAYSKACHDSLKIIELEYGFELEIIFDYINIDKINYLLQNSNIISKSFDDKIKYIIHISKTEYNNIIKNLNIISSIKIVKDIYTKK